MQYLNNLTLFAVRPSSLSGTRRLESSQESKSRRKTTHQDVVNPLALSGFNQISTGLFRLCRGYGSKLQILNAWAVQNSLADELEDKIRAMEGRFNLMAQEFIETFPQKNREWADERPEEADDILRLAYTKDDLKNGFRFAYARFQLTPEQIQAQAGLEEEILGMAGQALKEFSDQLRDMGV